MSQGKIRAIIRRKPITMIAHIGNLVSMCNMEINLGTPSFSFSFPMEIITETECKKVIKTRFVSLNLEQH
jgi:hypothetical protein